MTPQGDDAPAAPMITGGCFCGAVRFSLSQPPLGARQCWCRDCQYLACGNSSVNVVFETAALRCEGEMAEYVSHADSGALMRRRFCRQCGTQIFSSADTRPHLVVVRAGALDDAAMVQPGSVIWTASAPHWAQIDAALPCFAGQPPPIKPAPSS